MSVTIVGCGGIGLLLAASLIEGGEEVFLLERTPRRAAALQTILREGAEGKKRFPVRAFGDPNDLPPTEWIVVAVKAYDTEGAVRGIADLAHAARATIVLQNGLPRYDVLAAYLPRWLVGVTYQGATRKGTGHVLHAGRGETILGAVGGSAQEDCAEAAAEVFRRGGWPTRV
ncbi:MAG: ketopantoate reductase family protein, partial [Deltaproteobacteria bacterium]